MNAENITIAKLEDDAPAPILSLFKNHTGEFRREKVRF